MTEPQIPRYSFNPCDAHFRRIHRDLQSHMSYTAFMRRHACLVTLRSKSVKSKHRLDCYWQWYLALTKKLRNELQSIRLRIFSVDLTSGHLHGVLLIPITTTEIERLNVNLPLRQIKCAHGIVVLPYDVERVQRTFRRSSYDVWMWSAFGKVGL